MRGLSSVQLVGLAGLLMLEQESEEDGLDGEVGFVGLVLALDDGRLVDLTAPGLGSLLLLPLLFPVLLGLGWSPGDGEDGEGLILLANFLAVLLSLEVDAGFFALVDVCFSTRVGNGVSSD